MADLPDFYSFVETTLTKAINLTNGLDAAKEASPTVGDVYVATDTHRLYICFTAGTWTAIAALTVAETEVFNDTSPTSWTDLDLSGTVGSNAALVLLKIISPGANRVIAVRKNGDTDEFYAGASVSQAYGCATFMSVANIHAVLLVATDSSGVIEWKCELAETIVVDVMAYIK